MKIRLVTQSNPSFKRDSNFQKQKKGMQKERGQIWNATNRNTPENFLSALIKCIKREVFATSKLSDLGQVT